MKKTKFSWKSYWKQTPLVMRKLGDALLGVFTLLSTYSVITDSKFLSIVFIIIGALGKVLTNFFEDSHQTI